MKSAISFLFITCITLQLSAQTFSIPVSQQALGQINAASFGVITSGNPARLAFLEGFSGYASIENRFLQTDIRGFALGGSYGGAWGAFHGQLNRLGIDQYFRQELGLGYAKKLGDQAALGGQILLLRREAAEYDAANHITFRVGGQFPLSETVTAGILFSNPISDRKDNPTMNYPGEFAAGVNWKLKKITSAFEISKPNQGRYIVKLGLDYRLIESVGILGGIRLMEQESIPSLGILYRLKRLQILAGSTFSTQLPMGLGIELKWFTDATRSTQPTIP